MAAIVYEAVYWLDGGALVLARMSTNSRQNARRPPPRSETEKWCHALLVNDLLVCEDGLR